MSHPQHLEMMNIIAQNFGETLNEHEMAIQFLARFSMTIKLDHPEARREIEKYIRVSKGSYNRSLARHESPQKELFRVARERFGIEPNEIAAA